MDPMGKVGKFHAPRSVCPQATGPRYAGFAESAMMIHQNLDALTRETIRVRGNRGEGGPMEKKNMEKWRFCSLGKHWELDMGGFFLGVGFKQLDFFCSCLDPTVDIRFRCLNCVNFHAKQDKVRQGVSFSLQDLYIIIVEGTVPSRILAKPDKHLNTMNPKVWYHIWKVIRIHKSQLFWCSPGFFHTSSDLVVYFPAPELYKCRV
jgi:hypothetical protein